MKRVLITGAAGFSGRYLLRHLKRRGFQVLGTYHSRLPPKTAREDFEALDIMRFEKVAALLARFRPDGVVHLAAQSVPSRSWIEPEETFRINTAGTVNLLNAVLHAAPRATFVFPSTSYAYGYSFRSGSGCARERDLLWPENPYGASKVSGELACLDFSARFKTVVMIARAFSHTGPGQLEDFVFSNWCRQIALAEAGRGSPSLEVGDLGLERDFLHVEDVVRAYEILLCKGESGGIYNICTGRPRPLRDYVEYLLGRAKIPIRVHPQKKRFRREDPRRVWGDPSRIKKLGWKPEKTAFHGVGELLEEWREKFSVE